jgi:hypothetical protein
VSKILDSVTETLTVNPERRFLWAEISFFHLWWTRTSDDKRHKWKRLLERGQVEFVIGGWVMNDEGVTTHNANIEQMTHGHRILKDLFGDLGIPRVGWDIDPFGASINVARMYKEMGFDYHVIARINENLKAELRQEKRLEYMWKVDSNQTQILTHLLYDSYCTPRGFVWEGTYPCCTPNATANPPITPDNVADRSQVLIDIIQERAQAFRTSHILFPFG